MRQISKMDRDRILTLWGIGWPARRISRELGLHRDTVRAHLKAAGCPLVLGRPKSAISRRKVPADSGELNQNQPFMGPSARRLLRPARVTGNSSYKASREVNPLRFSGRTWSMSGASQALTTRSNALSASSRRRPRRYLPSFPPIPVGRPRWITAGERPLSIQRPGSIAAPGSSA